MRFKHTNIQRPQFRPSAEARACHFKSERARAYDAAVEAESGVKASLGAVKDEQVRAMNSIIRATGAGWPKWANFMSLGTLKTADQNAYNAMFAEARARISDKCPELDAGWFKWLMSSSTRKAYYVAEGQMMQNIAGETKAKLESQDKELQDLQTRYGKNKKLFRKGGVKVSLKNTKARSKLLGAIDKAEKTTKAVYKSYAEFPPEVKLALQDEDKLVEDLVTRYEIIEPSEVDRLFKDNQDGKDTLLTRIASYFNGAEYMNKTSPGAIKLQELTFAKGGLESVDKIHKTLSKAIKSLKYSFFRNRSVSYYRSLLMLKNPNASRETKLQYLEETKRPGTRLKFNVPGVGKIESFLKCKDGTMYRAKDTKGNVYLLDVGSAGDDAAQRDKFCLVMPPAKGSKDPREAELPWTALEISPT